MCSYLDEILDAMIDMRGDTSVFFLTFLLMIFVIDESRTLMGLLHFFYLSLDVFQED